MEQPLDQNHQFSVLESYINEYWPRFKSSKIGRTEIKKELNGKLTNEEIDYILYQLSDRHLSGYKGSDLMQNIEVSDSKTAAYLYLILGVLIALFGVFLTWIFWQLGWIIFLTLFLISTGLAIIFKANKKINSINRKYQ